MIIDNFLVAAEDKWGQRCGLVMLLPHGYEGQGPEHSSARIERFLTLCATDNLRLAQPTTAAQYFHLLRSQVRGSGGQPLVVMTPKSLLRAEVSRSPIEELTSGGFRTVVDDPAAGSGPRIGDSLLSASEIEPSQVAKVVLCSGKIAFDAMRWRGEERGNHTWARCGRRPRRAAVSMAGRSVGGGASPVPSCDGARLVAGRAREHGGVAVRAQSPAPSCEGSLLAASCEPTRVGEPGNGECGSAQFGA